MFMYFRINSFGAKYQTTFIVCFSSSCFFNKLSLGKKFICKVKRLSNSVDHYEPSHLDLCCLQKPIIITCSSERVNTRNPKISKLIT